MGISFTENYKDKDYALSIRDGWQQGKQSFRLFSSGSTGSPKEIELKRDLLEWSVRSSQEAFQLQGPRIFCCLPIDKTGGFMQVIRATEFNWDILITEPGVDALDILKPHHGYTMTSLTPFQLKHALEYYPAQLSQFTTVLIGGAEIPEAVLRSTVNFQKEHHKCRFFETYGMTETASHIAYRSTGEGLFRPLPGVELRTVDDCLAISIPSVGLDIQTNDIAVVQESGFNILGRADDVINTGGIKIHPIAVERQIRQTLNEMGINKEIVLGSRPHEALGSELILFMESTPMQEAAFILEVLKRELDNYHSPKHIEYVKELERTDTGKINRRKYR